MREDDAIGLFVQVLTKANTEQVQALERGASDKITRRLIEQYHVDFLGCLPGGLVSIGHCRTQPQRP